MWKLVLSRRSWGTQKTISILKKLIRATFIPLFLENIYGCLLRSQMIMMQIPDFMTYWMPWYWPHWPCDPNTSTIKYISSTSSTDMTDTINTVAKLIHPNRFLWPHSKKWMNPFWSKVVLSREPPNLFKMRYKQYQKMVSNLLPVQNHFWFNY